MGCFEIAPGRHITAAHLARISPMTIISSAGQNISRTIGHFRMRLEKDVVKAKGSLDGNRGDEALLIPLFLLRKEDFLKIPNVTQ